ncbi:cell wall hydrolase [Microgenomates group bacterium]|nr:cell wall hydrolase [Microgenomates group bacterium]
MLVLLVGVALVAAIIIVGDRNKPQEATVVEEKETYQQQPVIIEVKAVSEEEMVEARIRDYNLAVYELCAQMDSPLPYFFPLTDYPAVLAWAIGQNNFESGEIYVESWNENEMAKRRFRDEFNQEVPKYESRLRVMTLDEFGDAALHWWLSSNSGYTQRAWNEAWARAHEPFLELDFELLYYTAKVINIVAGGDFISSDVKMKAGQVFLNRIAHEAYPDTAAEVFFQPRQYDTARLEEARPSREEVLIAMQLLTQPDRSPLPENVVFSGTAVQGEVYEEVEVPELGVTIYFGGVD